MILNRLICPWSKVGASQLAVTRLVCWGAITSSRTLHTDEQDTRKITKLLVANRGEIACRVISTAKRLGIATVAVYSEADRKAPHVQQADESYCIGPPPASSSYLSCSRLLEVASLSGATALHPGYGFLSESATFAHMCDNAGVTFVGPPAAAIRAMGDKSEAKTLMERAGVPLVPGYHGSEQDESALVEACMGLGMPLLIKPVAGGGGKGMKIVESACDLLAALQSARREAASSFGDERLLVERYIRRSRHVEVQVFADGHGNALHLYDRDCSVQRRHQKVVEEAPAPGLPPPLRRAMCESAVRAALAVGYRSAGTVEFIVDCDTNSFHFMEMNTRLQVEHPVTEAITGVDLVEWQLHVAAGGKLPLTQDQITCTGHAVEVRLYAENPYNNFLPGAGRVRRWRPPPSAASFTPGAVVRVDSGVREGDEVGIHYDPMIAKVVTRGRDRTEALNNMSKALAQTQVCGLPTNLSFLQRLVAHPALVGLQQLDTGFIPAHADDLLHPPRPSKQEGALAALIFLKDKARQPRAAAGSPPGPWAIPDAKRLWAKHTQGVSFSAADQQLPINLQVTYLSATDFLVETEGDSTSGGVHLKNVALVGDDRLEAEVGGRLLHCDFCSYTQGDDRVVALWIDGHGSEYRSSTPSWSKDASAVVTHGRVNAPMTGKVVKVLVSVGDAVRAGETVAVLEAMKMEHAVSAPQDGVVAEVKVHVGGQVQDGQLLMAID